MEKNILEIDSNIIEPQELLERVRNNILQKNIPDIIVNNNFENSDEAAEYLNKIKHEINILSQYYNIQSNDITSHRPIIGWFIIFIRKLTFRLWKPYWDKQNLYNKMILQSFKNITNLLEKLLKK